MADKKKNNTTKKTKNEPAPKKMRKEVLDSVLAVVFFALTLLLALSVYVNVLGVFGGFLHAFVHGLFGATSYFLPIFTAWLGISLLRENEVSRNMRLVMGLIFAVCLSGVWYLFEPASYFGAYDFGGFFLECIPDMVNSAGGIAGGLFAYPLI